MARFTIKVAEVAAQERRDAVALQCYNPPSGGGDFAALKHAQLRDPDGARGKRSVAPLSE